MVVVTGASGFIGSQLLAYLNDQSCRDIVIVDDFRRFKLMNLVGKYFFSKVHRDQLFDWLKIYGKEVRAFYHLGARTDTTERNQQIFHQLNLNYSKRVWQFCAEYQVPLVYASSAATYGLGNFGFVDNHELCKKLLPLNAYAISKNEFDKWALQQRLQPPFWVGLKFFNVFGPNEQHKERMASVVLHAFRQIQQSGRMRLFRSHQSDIRDGHQKRDFIYVDDIVQLCFFFMQQQPQSGLYNAGTGRARTFLDLVKATFGAMNYSLNIEFIDTPLDIRDTYQYFTEADMKKTRNAGYQNEFIALEEGVARYVHMLKDY